jgi:hypothetical protein
MNVNAGIRRHSLDDSNIIDTDFEMMSYVLGKSDSPPIPPPVPTRKSKRKHNVRQTASLLFVVDFYILNIRRHLIRNLCIHYQFAPNFDWRDLLTSTCRENMRQRIKLFLEKVLLQADIQLDTRHQHKINCFEYVIHEYICESNKDYINDDALPAMVFEAAEFIKFVKENALDL